MSVAVVTSSAGVLRERDTFDSLIRIVRAEFIEMPGMHLTRMQFRRLWHLSDADCDQLLSHLIDTGFLIESGDGVSRPADH